MGMKEAAVAVVVMAVIVSSAAVCVVVYTNNQNSDDDPESFSITYVMNDGTNSADNPSSYTKGTDIVLNEPVRDGYVFIGWYTDEELTNEITIISKDSEGDLTLYAGWEESAVGSKLTFTLSGTVSNRNGPMTQVTSTISGTVSFSYLSYKYTRGYLMERNESITVITALTNETTSDTDSYWTSENDTEWTEGSSKTIETAFGTKECKTWISREGNSTETQYEGDDGIVYLIEYTSTTRNGMYTSITELTYALTEIGTVALADNFDVTVYCDKDVTVVGSGSHTAYEDVTLTAIGESFSGWYNESDELISSKTTYTIDKFVSDVTVYARNNSDADVVSDSYTATVSPSVQLTGVTWKFTDDTETTVVSDTLTHTFSEPGNYTLFYTGTKTDGSTYHGMLDVLIDSLVARTYDWSYDGNDYHMTINIRYSDYLAYRNDTAATRHQVDNEHDSIYFTTDDQYIGFVATKLEEYAYGHDSLWKAGLILSFVQSTEYVTDTVSRGQDEFWKYPVETLYDMNGDCEDTSFLFATIAKKMGYECCTMIFSDHMAAGIVVDGCSGYYYDYDSKHYYYCETTSDTWEVGHEPSNTYKQNRVVRYIVA